MDDMLPESGLFAWWANAWLAGGVPTDTVLEVLESAGPVHSVRSREDSGWAAEGSGILPLLTLLRAEGALHVGAAFPQPGDPVGLAGPLAFNRAAMDAGQAFVAPLVGLGAVPTRVGAGVTWTLHRINRRPPGDVGEADRVLRAALRNAVEDLVRLDVAAWSPDTADSLMDLRHGPQFEAPPGVPAQAVRLAQRAAHLWSITDHALKDSGGATSLAEVAAREQVLEGLAVAARRALTAACSGDAWPEP